MSDKHLELRDAMEFQDITSVLELSKLLSGGAALIDAPNSRVVRSSHHFRGRDHGHHVTRGARCGYRGVRLGEALNHSRSRNEVRATVADRSFDDDYPSGTVERSFCKLVGHAGM